MPNYVITHHKSILNKQPKKIQLQVTGKTTLQLTETTYINNLLPINLHKSQPVKNGIKYYCKKSHKMKRHN